MLCCDTRAGIEHAGGPSCLTRVSRAIRRMLSHEALGSATTRGTPIRGRTHQPRRRCGLRSGCGQRSCLVLGFARPRGHVRYASAGSGLCLVHRAGKGQSWSAPQASAGWQIAGGTWQASVTGGRRSAGSCTAARCVSDNACMNIRHSRPQEAKIPVYTT